MALTSNCADKLIKDMDVELLVNADLVGERQDWGCILSIATSCARGHNFDLILNGFNKR